jgi:hypothetical protein
MAMLDAVYVDAKEERRIVAIRPRQVDMGTVESDDVHSQSIRQSLTSGT